MKLKNKINQKNKLILNTWQCFYKDSPKINFLNDYNIYKYNSKNKLFIKFIFIFI